VAGSAERRIFIKSFAGSRYFKVKVYDVEGLEEDAGIFSTYIPM
jgi:hypothetical protein